MQIHRYFCNFDEKTDFAPWYSKQLVRLSALYRLLRTLIHYYFFSSVILRSKSNSAYCYKKVFQKAYLEQKVHFWISDLKS